MLRHASGWTQGKFLVTFFSLPNLFHNVLNNFGSKFSSRVKYFLIQYAGIGISKDEKTRFYFQK